MADRFPLHLLPQKALSNVLLCMRSIDCLYYSRCTQQCKRSVVELNFVVSDFEITFHYTYFNLFMTLPDNAIVYISANDLPHEHINLEVAQDFLVQYGPSWDDGGPYVQEAGNVVTLKAIDMKDSPFPCTHMSFKDWFEHCKRIFHLKRIKTFELVATDYQLDMTQVGRIVEGMRIESVDSHVLPRDTFQQFLALHLSAEDICLLSESFHLNREFVKQTIIENMERVNGGLFNNGALISLDEMLLTNATQVHICVNERIVGKDFNRFVRCWMRGSNRRFKVLTLMISHNTTFDETVVLRGIRHTKMSWERLTQKLDENGYGRIGRIGLYGISIICNIRSVHGREATIAFGTNMARLYVWN